MLIFEIIAVIIGFALSVVALSIMITIFIGVAICIEDFKE